MKRNLFKASDIRSKRTNFDEESSNGLCHAIAYYMLHDVKTKSVVLARDSRIGGETLMQTAVDIFVQSGLTVYLEANPIGSCQFYYACMQRPESGGVMITASHNPGSYLGMKIVATDVESVSVESGPEGGLGKIEFYYDKPLVANKRKGGSIIPLNTMDQFIDYSMRLAGVPSGSLEGLSVVCDFLHGSFGPAVSRALTQCGVDGVYRHLVPNGNFPVGDPNPGIDASMRSTLAYLAENPTDLCFAYDGDGDRMDFIYKGSQLSPSFVMGVISNELKSLFAPYFGSDEESFEPTFLFDIKAAPTLLLRSVMQGKKIALVQNGHSHVKSALVRGREEHLLAAVEESAHYYLQFPQSVDSWDSPKFSTENTLFYTLLVLKAYVQDPARFDEAKRLQDSSWRAREWSIMIKEAGKRIALQDEIEELMFKMGASKVTENEQGETLGASLYRFNLPLQYDAKAELKTPWFQVFQRVSQSEDALLRWEVIASDERIGQRVFEEIAKVQQRYR
jgi:phosphomannomutase